MPVLSDADRQLVAFALMDLPTSVRGVVAGMIKADVKAAVDATDAWIQANQGAFNAALPATARTNLTADQKTLLFTQVAKKRAEVI